MTYLSVITAVHTFISLAAIVAGVFAVADLFRPSAGGTAMRLFLWTAFLTSATGFLFPGLTLTPAVIVGILALLVLAAVAWAGRRLHRVGPYRAVFGAGVVASLYLLVFVGIAQAFQKVPVLHAFAPTGGEPPFAVAQGITLLGFIVLGVAAARRGGCVQCSPRLKDDRSGGGVAGPAHQGLCRHREQRAVAAARVGGGAAVADGRFLEFGQGIGAGFGGQGHHFRDGVQQVQHVPGGERGQGMGDKAALIGAPLRRQAIPRLQQRRALAGGRVGFLGHPFQQVNRYHHVL